VTEKHPNQDADKGGESLRLPSVLGRVRKALADYSEGKLPKSPLLPICRSFAPQRDFESKTRRVANTSDGVRLNSPLGTYLIDDSQRVRFDAFVQWFEALSLELAQEQMTGRPSPHKPEILLEAIRKPVEKVLEHTGWTRLIWDYAERDLVAEHPDLGTLPVSELSDGIRTTIAMVGDLAHRAVRLNRHLGIDAAKLTPGVVVIDEVDLHLHPRWQQTILGLLMEAFPLVQFIVTTHSPQVISTVPRECIRVLSIDADGMGTAATPDFSPLAQDAGMALARIFDTPTRPDLPVLAHLHAYEMYVRHGQEALPEAQAALKRIVDAGVEIPSADLDLWRFLAKRLAAQ
jgi:predicted ATP-binding protein involved in virulence